jgi:hypothetical protein
MWEEGSKVQNICQQPGAAAMTFTGLTTGVQHLPPLLDLPLLGCLLPPTPPPPPHTHCLSNPATRLLHCMSHDLSRLFMVLNPC